MIDIRNLTLEDIRFEHRDALLASLTGMFPEYGEILEGGKPRNIIGAALVSSLLTSEFFSPDMRRITGESVIVMATLLGHVADKFGTNAAAPVWHSGSMYQGVPMINHHSLHSFDGVKGALMTGMMIRADQEAAVSLTGILNGGIAMAGHDIVQGGGRRIEEAQSAAFVAAYVRSLGFPVERQRSIFNAVRGTTFDEQKKTQAVDLGDPTSVAAGNGDLIQLTQADYPVQSYGISENIWRGLPPFDNPEVIAAVQRRFQNVPAGATSREIAEMLSDIEEVREPFLRFYEGQVIFTDRSHPNGHKYPYARTDERFSGTPNYPGRDVNRDFSTRIVTRLRDPKTTVLDIHEEVHEEVRTRAEAAAAAQGPPAPRPGRETITVRRYYPQGLFNSRLELKPSPEWVPPDIAAFASHALGVISEPDAARLSRPYWPGPVPEQDLPTEEPPPATPGQARPPAERGGGAEAPARQQGAQRPGASVDDEQPGTPDDRQSRSPGGSQRQPPMPPGQASSPTPGTQPGRQLDAQGLGRDRGTFPTPPAAPGWSGKTAPGQLPDTGTRGAPGRPRGPDLDHGPRGLGLEK